MLISQRPTLTEDSVVDTRSRFVIEPLEPGFRRMRIRPQLGDLSHAAIELPTIRGTVRLKCTSSPERHVAQIELPANTTAQVYLPRLEPKDGRLFEGKTAVPARVEGEAHRRLRGHRPGRCEGVGQSRVGTAPPSPPRRRPLPDPSPPPTVNRCYPLSCFFSV